jgi:hypothetical protein
MTDETNPDDRNIKTPARQNPASRQPRYLDVDEARAILAEMNVHLSRRQVKRSSEMDARGKRRLPWFIDPIEGRLKIERNDLFAAYFNRQVEAERNCTLNPREGER